MVVIVKGDKKLTVPTSAYNNYYKNAGWIIRNGKKQEKELEDNNSVEKEEKEVIDDVTEETEENSNEDADGSDDEDWDSVMEDEEVEKPLSEMNRQELEDKAASLGVDITGLSTNKQIREAIRNYGK